MPTLASQLTGMQLDGDWEVVEHIQRSYQLTGGRFSESYRVTSPNGDVAFLKAVDLSIAADMPGSLADNLKSLIDAYIAERDILQKCKNHRLTRVITAITSGEVRVNSSPLGRVPYIIFERAQGDIRTELARQDVFDIALSLRYLHNLCVGLQQLHGVDIAHQDVKPSNVLIFPEQGAKLADLGRASYKGHPSTHDELTIAGDLTYAPPELRYGHVSTDWNVRRNACDTYLFGSMVVFIFSGVPLTPWIDQRLPREFSWRAWKDDYASALPYIKRTFVEVLDEFSVNIPEPYRQHVTSAVLQLCDPDPSKRGHPKNRLSTGDSYSLERYVSLFNRLARHAELQIRRQP